MPVKILRELRLKAGEPIVEPEASEPEAPSPARLEDKIIILDEAELFRYYQDRGLGQEGWASQAKGADDKQFASMADIYQLAKQLKQNNARYDKLLATLLGQYVWEKPLVTSTRVTYQKSSLAAKISHNYNSRKFRRTIEVDIPIYQSAEIRTVVNYPEGLAFIQALFGTQDNKDEINEVLGFFRRNFHYDVGTLDSDKRGFNPINAVILDRIFMPSVRIDCGKKTTHDGGGRSFWIRYADEKNRKETKCQ